VVWPAHFALSRDSSTGREWANFGVRPTGARCRGTGTATPPGGSFPPGDSV